MFSAFRADAIPFLTLSLVYTVCAVIDPEVRAVFISADKKITPLCLKGRTFSQIASLPLKNFQVFCFPGEGQPELLLIQ